MLRPISYFIHLAASKIDFSNKKDITGIDAIIKEMKSTYNTKVKKGTKPEHVMALYGALKKLPAQLVRDCNMDEIGFEDLGPSKEFYPNHGRYLNGALTINERILYEPKIQTDGAGHKLNEFSQVLYHEMGHSYDNDDKFSLKDDWLKLSDWSEKPIPGHKRLIIREDGCPELKGEWYYGPNAKFTRFYARRNPWDCWADEFSFFVGGLKSIVPKEKREYFEKLFKKYYE